MNQSANCANSRETDTGRDALPIWKSAFQFKARAWRKARSANSFSFPVLTLRLCAFALNLIPIGHCPLKRELDEWVSALYDPRPERRFPNRLVGATLTPCRFGNRRSNSKRERGGTLQGLIRPDHGRKSPRPIRLRREASARRVCRQMNPSRRAAFTPLHSPHCEQRPNQRKDAKTRRRKGEREIAGLISTSPVGEPLSLFCADLAAFRLCAFALKQNPFGRRPLKRNKFRAP